MRKQLSIFWSKGFIAGLLILLINDHFLKAEFNNVITGKLSDLAGLFIFPIFFAAFFPKNKYAIYITTAIGFIWFKSPLSNSFIELFNGIDLFYISRVTDPTDLFALAVLPLSYRYLANYTYPPFQLNPIPVMVLSAVGFIATSRSPSVEIKYNQEYSFQYPIDSLKKKIFLHPNITNNYNREEWLRLDSIEHHAPVYPKKHYAKRKKELFDTYCDRPIYIDMEDTTHICNNDMARISIHQNRQISTLKLLDIRYRHCNQSEGKEDKDVLKEIFEKKIIEPLHE